MDEIFDATVDSPEGEEAEILSLMIDEYEKKHYAIEAPDPIEAIKIRMEEMNLIQTDLNDIIWKQEPSIRDTKPQTQTHYRHDS